MGKGALDPVGGRGTFCGDCGSALREGARFCAACGSPAAGPGAQPEPVARSRRSLGIGLFLLAVSVAVVSVLAWQRTRDRSTSVSSGAETPGASSEAGGSSEADGSGALPSSPVELGPAEAASAVGCSSPCTVTGVVAFEHPTWGPSSLVTSGVEAGDYELDVVDADGAVVWSHQFGTNWYELAPNDPAVDDTGHLFVDFNPGRYNGIIILSPVEDGFEDFATLPAYGDYNTRFYYADAVDVDGDGMLEVEVSENDCNPSCADGAITSTVYAWDGEDYR